MSEANLARLVVSLEAKIDKYEKSLSQAEAKAQSSAGKITKSLEGAESKWGALFGKSDPGKAIENVFSRSRLAVFEEGAAKIPLFGSAIEALGPAGLLAAGGMAALFLTMEKSEKAVEWAAGLAKLSKEIGVSTDFIQQFNFAAHQNEIDVGAADGALKGLNASLGAVQANLPRSERIAKVFAAIGFTPEQLRQYKNAGELFPVLADRIAKVGNVAEEAAIAKRLGIEELLPLLRDGANGFSALAEKARDLGIVMDASAIQKAEEAKKKLAELDDVMKAKANISFAAFADTLITVKEKFADAEKAGLSFLAAITGTTPKADLYAFSMKRLSTRDPLRDAIPGVREHDRQQAADRLKALLAESFGPKAAEGPAGKAATALVPGGGKGPRDDTAQRLESVNAAVAAASKDLLEAERALTANIGARAEMERQIVQKELEEHLARLGKQQADITADKGISDSTKRSLRARLDEAKTAEQKAAQAKLDLIARQADWAAEDQADETRRILRESEIGQLELAADLATTQQERNRIEAEIAKIKALELQHEQGKALSRAEETGQLSDEEGGRRFAAEQAGAAAQEARDARQRLLNAHPLAAYADQLKDLNHLFEGDAVEGIRSFADGVADAAVNAKSLGDVASAVFRQMLAQMLSQAIQQGVTSTALAIFGIPAHAAGTNFAPGGLSLVGERGPELLNIPRGSQIIPNGGIANAVRGGGSTIVYQTFHLDGAVTTDNLMAHIDRVSTQKAMGAVGTAKTETLKALAAARTGHMGR